MSIHVRPSDKTKSLDECLLYAASVGASDIHCLSHRDTILRVNGQLVTAPKDKNVDIGEVFSAFSAGDDVASLDISYSTASKKVNARINAFKDSNGSAMAIRIIQKEIPTMKSLFMPVPLFDLIKKEQGLILFCGPTGSGKSTSVAAVIQAIHETRKARIITIEDPIEYVYRAGQSIISQREVGTHVESFADGLHAALREDPDIILVGELRDRDSIETALQASESGHLVFSTLHAGSVIEAADRLTQYFPLTAQKRISYQFANSFQAVIAQKLFKRSDCEGRIAAYEVLLRNTATVNLIRQNRMHLVKDYMLQASGMQTMDDSIKDLKNRHYIKGDI